MRGKRLIKLNRSQARSQIAVYLILLMAIIFVFILITINIHQASQFRTMVSTAADGSALLLASEIGSYGRAQWDTYLASQGAKDDGSYEICKINWVLIVGLIAIVALAVATAFGCGPCGAVAAKLGGALFGATGGAAVALGTALIAGLTLTSQVLADRAIINTLNRQFEKLPLKPRFVEEALVNALFQTVDDPERVRDIHDINENGKTDDYVSRFLLVETERLRYINGLWGPLSELANEILAFFNASDRFRQYVGGTQQFPEFIANPGWLALARAVDPTIPPNNPYYPQDGEFMRLLADFRGVNLPRAGGGNKPFMFITNVNLTNINAQFYSLTDYNEDLVYYFPFWQTGLQDNSGIDALYSPDCPTFSSMGDNPAMQTRIDEADYAVWLLGLYRVWAWGAYGDDITGETPIKFNPGIGQLGEDELKATFNVWYKQLIQTDPPPDGEAPLITWRVQLEDLLRKVKGNPYAPSPNCGWYKELDKVLRNKLFYTYRGAPSQSDVLNQYAGLGTINPADMIPYCGGKRKELKDKMQRVCLKLTQLVGQFNQNLCPAWSKPLMDACGTISVSQDAALQIQCSLCFEAGCANWTRLVDIGCIDRMITAIIAKQTEINNKITALTTAQNNCRQCCSNNYNNCATGCANAFASCESNCYSAASSCHNSCGTCNCNCAGITDPIAYQTCVNDCNSCQMCHNGCDNDEWDCLYAGGCSGSCASELNLCKDAACGTCGRNSCNCTWSTNCRADCDSVNAISPSLGPIPCRQRELSGQPWSLDQILLYAQALRKLAVALQYVETLITRVEDSQREVRDFFQAGAYFLAYITDPARIATLKNLENNVYSLPAINESGASMSWGSTATETTATYQWSTYDMNKQPIVHRVYVSVSNDFKLPHIKIKRCAWIFGRGARLEDYAGDVRVSIRRDDGGKTINLGFFNWTFFQNTASASATAHFEPKTEAIRITSTN
ncbi:MAG: hypothetical protein ACM3IL_01445 [Deltaproteobacteria bacterium]